MHLSDQLRKVVSRAMISLLSGTVVVAALGFGAVTIDVLAVLYGLAVLLALLWAVKLILARRVSWKHSPLHFAVAAFALYAVARYFTSPFEYAARLELFQLLLCVFFYFAAAANFYHQRDRTVLLNVLVGLALLQAGYAMWQFFSHAETVLHITRPEIYQHRGSGTFICPNHYAAFLGMTLGMALAYVAVRRTRSRSVERSTLFKVYLIYAALVIAAGILVSLSRAGWVATAVGVLAVLLWGDWRQRAMWPRIAVAIVAVTSLILIATKVDAVRDYITITLTAQQTDQPSTLRDPSLGGRTHLWKATLAIIGDQPLFGTGGGSWQWHHLKYRHPDIQRRPEYAHNDLLQLTSDYGLLGLALGLAVLGCFYWHAILLTRSQTPSEQRAFAVGALIATTVILFHSWFDFNLHIPANALLLAVLMGFTAAIDDPGRRFPRVQLKPPARWTLAVVAVAITVLAGAHAGRSARAYRHLLEGKMAQEHQDFEEAIPAYKRAVALDPRYPEAHLRLANAYLTQAIWRRDPERAAEREDLLRQAVAGYQRVLELQPLDSEVMLRLAKAWADLGEPDRALQLHLRALEIDPNSAEVNLRLGQFYARIGETEKAEAALKRSQAITEGSNYPADLTLQELTEPDSQQPEQPEQPEEPE